MPAAITIKIFVVFELRPDRGGLVGPDMNYLGRDEDGCVLMRGSSK
jgi:hypothetical protein